VVFVCCCFCHAFFFPFGGVVFLMPVFGVFLLGQIVLIRILLAVASGFCLESLILAQDERWRRA
jgi:hypothetical protein